MDFEPIPNSLSYEVPLGALVPKPLVIDPGGDQFKFSTRRLKKITKAFTAGRHEALVELKMTPDEISMQVGVGFAALTLIDEKESLRLAKSRRKATLGSSREAEVRAAADELKKLQSVDLARLLATETGLSQSAIKDAARSLSEDQAALRSLRQLHVLGAEDCCDSDAQKLGDVGEGLVTFGATSTGTVGPDDSRTVPMAEALGIKISPEQAAKIFAGTKLDPTGCGCEIVSKAWVDKRDWSWSYDFTIPYPCGVKWCKKWGVPYPCGVKWCKKKFTFGFSAKVSLYATAEVDCTGFRFSVGGQACATATILGVKKKTCVVVEGVLGAGAAVEITAGPNEGKCMYGAELAVSVSVIVFGKKIAKGSKGYDFAVELPCPKKECLEPALDPVDIIPKIIAFDG